MAAFAGSSPLLTPGDQTAAPAARSSDVPIIPGLTQPLPQVPRLRLTLGDDVGDGWHAARLIQEQPNLDFYVQSIAVRWPFRITRPWKGVRHELPDPDLATAVPDPTVAVRTLRIDWSWVQTPEGRPVLPLFIKRGGLLWLRRTCPVPARLVLKDMSIRGSVIALKVASDPLNWTRLGIPASRPPTIPLASVNQPRR